MTSQLEVVTFGIGGLADSSTVGQDGCAAFLFESAPVFNRRQLS